MLGCTLKEYVEHFDEKLANYLEEYADNTPISFLENQIQLFGHYQYQIQKILSELTIYGEENASEVFLESNIFEGLKKIDNDSYQNILIEEKPNDIQRLYVRVGEYRSKLKVRVNFTTLKNINTSVDKIVKFIENKYKIFEQENQQIIPTALGEQHKLGNTETAILEEVISNQLESEDELDPDKAIKEIIEKNLKELKGYLSDSDYKALANAMLEYCTKDNFPQLKHKIFFDPIDKKRVGHALKTIVKTIKRGSLNIKLFKFAQQHINLFQDEVIVDTKFTRSSFYRSFTNPLN